MTPAERFSNRMPSASEIEAIAGETLARLPSPFAESLGEIVLTIEEIAGKETTHRLGLKDPMGLSGLYQGVPLNRQSTTQSGTLPERITLYRRPIILEWQTTPFSLDQIVSHVLIHEVGHHFGFSDDDMHALERAPE